MVCKVCGAKSRSGMCLKCEFLKEEQKASFSKQGKVPKHYKVFISNLGALIRLCHPDRHNNSEQSTQITQWLLQVRKDSKEGVPNSPDILEESESGKWKKRRK